MGHLANYEDLVIKIIDNDKNYTFPGIGDSLEDVGLNNFVYNIIINILLMLAETMI